MWCRLTGARQPVWTRGLRCSLLPAEDDLRVFRSLRECSSPSLRNLLCLLRLMSGSILLPSLQRIRSLSPGLDEGRSRQPALETLCPRRGGANVATHCAPIYVSDLHPLWRHITSTAPVVTSRYLLCVGTGSADFTHTRLPPRSLNLQLSF